MKTIVNKATYSGYLYEHNLTLKTTGPNSKNPGTEFISGTISIATDKEVTNIIQIHYTYVTATTAKGNANRAFDILKNIIDGNLKCYVDAGEACACIKAEPSVSLNEFYSDRNGTEELVSVKRNEGGFLTKLSSFASANEFECDMLITRIKINEADPEKGTPETAKIGGYVFDFRGALLPIEFSAVKPNVVNYYATLNVSSAEPIFTNIRGNVINQTVVTRVEETSKFGDVYVKETERTYVDWVIFYQADEDYEWDTEGVLTAAEMNEKITARNTYLAEIKMRNDEYKASKASTPKVSAADAVPEFKW